jgi:NHLM bacteriocin system ABC transporter ATP-binding protein
MPTLLELFETEGTPREVAGNNPLPLDDRDSVWLVAAGRVDVFALLPTKGEVSGARLHLFRAEPGQVLFGVGTAGSRAKTGLLAVGDPGSRVHRLARERFGELCQRPELCDPLTALLDDWVHMLTAAVAHRQLPKKATMLEPGQEVQLEANGIASPVRGTLWVRHDRGSSQFLGTIEPPLRPADGLVPLSGPGWLAAREEDTYLVPVATETALSEGQWKSGLDRFHQLILAWVSVYADEADDAERDRLRQRARADRRLVRATLSQLARVAADEDLDDLGVRTEGDPLLVACRLVGDRLRVAITAPLGTIEKRRRSDPVSAIARASRIRVRRVLLGGEWWRKDNGPLLAFHADDERPIALLPLSPSRYELVDPAAKTRTVLTAANVSAVLPFAYTFYPPFPARALTPWDFFRIAGGRRDWLLVILLGFAGGLLGLFTPIVTGWVFDWIIPGAERDELLLVVLALTASAVAAAVFQVTQGIAMLRLEVGMDSAVQAGVWDRLLNLPAPFFRKYTAGDLALRALGIGTIRQVLTDVALSSVLGFIFSLVYFGLLFYYDVRLAILACVFFVVVLLTTFLGALIQLRYQRKIYEVRGKIGGVVLQLITGISRLRVAGAEDRALAVWAKDFSLQRKLTFRARSVVNYLAAFNAAVPIVSMMVLFATVSLLPHEGLSLGSFLAFNVAFTQVIYSALMMSSAIGSAIQMVPLYERTRPILDTLPEVDVSKATPGDLSGDIEISHVSFRYKADGPLILDDISLHIRAGEFVAFVGPSGAGKSTIIRLLLGFETPTAGSLYYDREDLAGLDRQSVRRQIGVVLQDGKLMSGDLFSNIIGSSLLTQEDAWEAARMSGLDQDIMQMPMGMHTVIGEGGSTLSGGQRQRLMIARAVVAKPRILLFDEATSALDNETQARVSRSLESLKATRIVVAHRVSTVKNADRIVVLAAGRIVEQGTYEELLGRGGLFADLVQRQLA